MNTSGKAMTISKVLGAWLIVMGSFASHAASDFESLVLRAIDGDADAVRQVTTQNPGSTQDLVDRYHSASEQGEALAAYRLAIIYRDGLGVPTDPTESLRQLKLSAERGNAAAMTELAIRYEQGKAGTVPSPLALLDYFRRDDVRAAVWLKQAASQEYLPAMTELGRFYLEGKGGLKKDAGEAVRLLVRAAQGGHVPAQFSLGAYHARQERSPEHAEKAVHWLGQAAAKDSEVAFSALENLAGQGSLEAHKTLARLYGQERPPRNHLALQHWQAAANLGDAYANFTLGQLAESGQVRPEDALAYYQEAASLNYQPALDRIRERVAGNDLDAISTLAGMYQEGDGVAASNAEAIRLYQAAARKGHRTSRVRLAMMAVAANPGLADFLANLHEREIGAERSMSEAAAWWNTSAGQGSALGRFRLAQLLEAGEFLPRDPAEAAKRYGEVYRLGNVVALFPLDRLAQAGLPAAQKTLGDILAIGFRPDRPATRLYVAAAAETLMHVAERSGIKLADWLEANPHFDGGSVIQAGDVIVIPAAAGFLRIDLPAGYVLDDAGRGAGTVAMNWWKKASDQGMADATLNLGKMLASRGDNIQALAAFRLAATQGSAEAVTLIRKSSDRDDLLAIDTLAGMYLEGQGVPRDEATGRHLLLRAARLGDTMAMVRVARHQLGAGDQGDALFWLANAAGKGSEEAVTMLRQLANQGNRAAADVVTSLLRRGGDAQALTRWLAAMAALGNPAAALEAAERMLSDPAAPQTEARNLLRQAAEAGNGRAQLRLAQLLEHPSTGQVADLAASIAWYARAAEAGLDEAVTALQRLSNGPSGDVAITALGQVAAKAGRQQDASRLFLKAATHGHLPAILEVAERYEKGVGLIKDSASAYAWNLKAAQAGNAEAQFRIALALYTGEGVDADPRAALPWFHMAGTQGDRHAALWLGRLSEAGGDSDARMSEAIDWYTRSAQQGLAEAQSALGRIYRRGLGVPVDYAKALDWYGRAADQGDPGAQVGLGTMYELGLGVAADGAKAIGYYQHASEKGRPGAHYRLARLYLEGTIVAQDLAAAAEHMENAAAANLPLAQYEVALMYRTGSGVDKDVELAAQWLLKAAEQHHVGAQLELAMAYLVGAGVERNDAAGFGLVSCLAESKTIPADIRDPSRLLLGSLYETGQGVSPDPVLAHCWYNLAAAGGLAEAEEARTLLEASMDAPKRRAAEQCARERDATLALATPSDNILNPECTALLWRPTIEGFGNAGSRTAGQASPIRVPLRSSHYYLRIRMGTSGYRDFMVDTGATSLCLRTSDLQSSGVPYLVVNPYAFSTLANDELVLGQLVQIKEIDVEGATLENVRAFVFDNCNDLAGQSVLRRFDLRTTRDDLELTLRP